MTRALVGTRVRHTYPRRRVCACSDVIPISGSCSLTGIRSFLRQLVRVTASPGWRAGTMTCLLGAHPVEAGGRRGAPGRWPRSRSADLEAFPVDVAACEAERGELFLEGAHH